MVPGPPGASRGLSGPPGASWGLLGAPGAFWGFLGLLGASWGLLGLFGASWAFWGPPGASLGSPGVSWIGRAAIESSPETCSHYICPLIPEWRTPKQGTQTTKIGPFCSASLDAGTRGQEDFGFAPWPAGPLPKGCASVFWVTPAPHFTDTL